jgi:hypothetical protein
MKIHSARSRKSVPLQDRPGDRRLRELAQTGQANRVQATGQTGEMNWAQMI